MRIIDDGTSRVDLQMRREVKYALSDSDLGMVRRVLEGSCRRVIYNKLVSTVRSIYFDDVHWTACLENLSGVGERRKVRLRWYDQLHPPSTFFFEIKWRKNSLTGKHRLQVSAAKPLADLSYRQMVAELTDVLPDKHRAALLLRPEPIVLVQYDREHFQSHDGLLRITLDYNLRFYDQLCKRRPSLSFGLPLHDLAVLEAKSPEGEEYALRELLYPFAPRITRWSKYVNGCRALGALAGTATVFDAE